MKKIRVNIVNIGIIFIIVTIFHNFSLAKNIYSIAKYKYDLRLPNTYDYCDNESIGFLSYDKKKYKINDEIQINKVFWHNTRLLHGVLYLLAAYYYF